MRTPGVCHRDIHAACSYWPVRLVKRFLQAILLIAGISQTGDHGMHDHTFCRFDPPMLL